MRYVRTGNGPAKRWVTEFKPVDEKGIVVVNAKGETKTVTWK